MTSSKPGGPRIRLENAPSGGPFQELAVRFMSPSNTSVGSAPLYTSVVGAYGASISVSSEEGERDAKLALLSQCRGHTPLGDMSIKGCSQPSIRLVACNRGKPYDAQTGTVLDDSDGGRDGVELSIDESPGIRVIGLCTDHSRPYRDAEMIPPAVGRSGRCRDHLAAYVASRSGVVASGAREYSGDSSERTMAARAQVMGECTHFQEVSETELSYEDHYEVGKMCVKHMREAPWKGGAVQAPGVTRKRSMVHIYAGDTDGDVPKDQYKQKPLCEMKDRYKTKKHPPSPPPSASPPSMERGGRTPCKPSPTSPPKQQPEPQSLPASRTPSRPSSSPSPARNSSRLSSRAQSGSLSRAEPRSPSMATKTKLEIEDMPWNTSYLSSINIELTKEQAKRLEKGSSRGKSSGCVRQASRKPVAPTPPPELRHAVQAGMALSKDSLEMIRRESTEKLKASKSKAATSAEMVMRAAWEQYYHEYDKYKVEMADWENMQRKMRKQLTRFMTGPGKPPAPPQGVQPMTGTSKAALAVSAPTEQQTSVTTNPKTEEGMHIRIGFPGRMVKRRGSKSLSAARPLEGAPPCVKAMYSHPGPLGPVAPPFAGSGVPFSGVGSPCSPPMLTPPPYQQFGPPGPFAPQQHPPPFAGMRAPRRSTSRITLNFM